MRKSLISTMLVIAAMGVGSNVSAGIIYSDFQHNGSEHVDYRVEINHNQQAGLFEVEYQVTGTASVGKFTGMFFDISEQYSAANLGLTNEYNPTSELSCTQGFGVSRYSDGGCNSTLNQGKFDIALIWERNDLTVGDGIGGFSFSDLGSLTLNDFAGVGMRAQAVNGGGSAKELQLAPTAVIIDDIAVASEPGMAALIGFGLFGLFASRRKVRKAS